tara:strand:+ start:1517 stop:3184 length:1668 start_codon:yes stop_codon:yes gene_type:complete
MTQPEYNANLRFPHTSGIVKALQNDLTLGASTSGDVIISPNALRPEVDIAQDLGTSNLRWHTLHVGNLTATSGTFGVRPTISGIGFATLADIVDTQIALNGLSGAISITSPDNTILIGDGPQAIELSGLFTQASGAVLEQHSQDLLDLSGLVLSDGGQTSINGLSGVVSITSPDGSILIGDSPQTIELSGLFTATSGAILEQKCADIDTLSGLVTNHMDSGQTSINGLSGAVSLISPDGSILIGDSPQTLEISGLFTNTSGSLLQQHSADLLNLSGLILPDGGQTSVEGISGVIDLDSPDGTVIINVNGQAIELTALPDAGQTSINSVSGALSLVAGNNGIVVNTADPTITLSPLFTYTSGQIIDQHSGDLLTLSGLILSDGGQTSIEGLSGVVDLDSPDGTVIIGVNGQAIELTVLPDAGQTSANGLSGALTLTSPDNSILIGDNGQSIELSGLFTPASGAVLHQKCEDIDTLSGLIPSSSLDKSALEFTEASGTSFVMYHGLNTLNFTWNMWEKVDSGDIQGYVLPKTLRPSGVDHVEVGLSAVMIGTLIIVA